MTDTTPTPAQNVVREMLRRIKTGVVNPKDWHVIRDNNVFSVNFEDGSGYSDEVSEARFLTEFLAFHEIESEYE